MTDIDQGWCIDDGPDEDDIWDDPWGDFEPDEPDFDLDCGCCEWPPRLYGRGKRREARFWDRVGRERRQPQRHRNDRFWQARNKPAVDDEAPF